MIQINKRPEVGRRHDLLLPDKSWRIINESDYCSVNSERGRKPGNSYGWEARTSRHSHISSLLQRKSNRPEVWKIVVILKMAIQKKPKQKKNVKFTSEIRGYLISEKSLCWLIDYSHIKTFSPVIFHIIFLLFWFFTRSILGRHILRIF